MIKLLILILFFTLLTITGCSDNSNPAGPPLPQISEEDLEGEWGGRLAYLKVKYDENLIITIDGKTTIIDTTVEKRFSNLRCSLKFESAIYFLELDYNDSYYIYNSNEWGQWELDKDSSGRLDFKTLQNSWELVDRSIEDVTSTQKKILKDPVSWHCDVEYKADTLRLYHIEGDLSYGEMKLVEQVVE